MKELPDDLGAMDADELARERAIRDEQLTPLFRRWPRLSRLEIRELRKIYVERLRIARYLGRLRTRTRRSSS
jgi:hypothetical protein